MPEGTAWIATPTRRYRDLHSRVSGVESSVSQLRGRVDALEKSLLRVVGELQQTVDEFVTEYRRDRTRPERLQRPRRGKR